MSVRSKIIVSYTLVLVVTILIFITTAFLVALAVTGDVRSFKPFYTIHFTLKPLTPEQESLYMDLKYIAKANPEKLFDDKLQKDYEFQLRVAKSSLLIRKGDVVDFASPQLEGTGVEQILPEYEMDNIRIRNSVNIGDRFYGYAKYDFMLPDKSPGSLFVIRELSPFTALTSKLLPLLISLLFIVLVLANVMLYFFITRRIIKPLDTLRMSAARIKEGDLDFRVVAESQDEIGQLSQQFEDMRRKLKESVDLQLQYESNRKELISNISHDLKTPITTIKGYIEGIRDGVPNTKEKMDKYVDTIYNKAVGMDRLIDELFLYSKLDLKKVPFDFVRIDLRTFIDALVGELRFELEQTGFEVEWEGKHGAPAYVRLDPNNMKRAIINIVDNSIKFMDKPEKRIRFAITVETGKISLIIADNGPGISNDEIQLIFDRFYRAETSRNVRTGGSGLGLSIAKQIVEGHHGSIGVESTPGESTQVSISFKPWEEA